MRKKLKNKIYRRSNKKVIIKGKKLIKRKNLNKNKKVKDNKYFNYIIDILIKLNILFILGCCLFYGTRLVYYYKIEHPKMKEVTTIIDSIDLNSVVKKGNGLYKIDNKYVYKGNVTDNYVKYSGRIWRIVSIDENNGIKLITNESQTSLVWGVNSDYENSYIRSWLNDSDKAIKSFYDSLNNTNIIGYTNTCIDLLLDSNITCDNVVSDRIGLLSAYEYQQAGGASSYLNIGEYWWLSNIDNDNVAWYVYSKGAINNTSYSGTIYYSYGVRPVITISGTATVISGNGTEDNPYNLDSVTDKVLSNKLIGNYITYSGYTWRIIDKEEDAIKVVLDGYIKDMDVPYLTKFGNTSYCSLKKGMCNYLNTSFYESLDKKEYIVEHEFNTGTYDKSSNYDYNSIANNKETLYVGLLQLGELFVNDYSKYFLGTRTNYNNVYEMLENGIIYAGELSDELRVRPTLYLKSDIKIVSGLGTKKRPYVLE